MSAANPDNTNNLTIKQLLQFISGYRNPEPPQSIEEIQGDFQLAGLSTLLNSYLSWDPTPKILDLGCGNGVLMAKLVEIKAFKNYPRLEYVGFDLPDRLTNAFETANKLKILPRIKLLPFENKWTEHATDPCIVVIRNVFHELKINEVAKLIHEICMFLPADSVILLQDMTTLPKAEKGRAGWLGIHLAKILERGGIRTTLTPDTSKRGVDVFLIEGRRDAKCGINERNILEILVAARKEQLSILSLQYEAMKEKPGNELPLLRLIHDIAAINLELVKFGVETGKEKEMKDGRIVASTFSLAFNNLSDLDFDDLRKNYQYPEIKWFQNRGHHIDALDNFLRSDKTIFILTAGPFMGKKTIVWLALDKKLRHERLPLFVNLTRGTDLLRIMEDIVIQLGIGGFVDIEILASLRSLPTGDLRKVISEAIMRFASKVIFILDGFENVIDPEGKIENEDILWLIDFWSNLHKAKIIIESRSEVKQLPFERCQFEYMTTFPSIGRKKHLYTIQLLNELIPISYRLPDMEFSGYPIELLNALDNHPYFTYIAGTIIRNNPDSTCLRDHEFVVSLKTRLYENLMSTFWLTDIEKEIIYALTLVQDAFPLKFVDKAAEDSRMAKKLLEKGLLLESSPGRFRPLGILRHFSRTERDERKQVDQKWHLVFAKVFKRLYNIESVPSFYRQAYYHATLAGDKSDLATYNLPEISICADSWYISRNYADSLWAYQKIQEKRKLYPKEQMKMASCLIRTSKITEGKNLYLNLFRRYKNWSGVKRSYVDSLLYIKGHAKSALNILLKIPEEEWDFYWHQQAARCYRQLSIRDKVYEEYEEAILQSPTDRVWPIIQELLIYAHEVGDDKKEAEWLDYTWFKLKLHFDAIKITLGAFYERIDKLEEAEELLREAHQTNPSNAYCILPLIKTLCRRGKIEEAASILEEIPANASPPEVLIYAKIFYFKTLGHFSECENLLITLPMHEKDRISVHRWGQWADLFLSWCQTLHGKEKIAIAERGLKFVKETIEGRNVPAMMACLELSKITEDIELQGTLQRIIHEVNDLYSF